MSRSEMKLHGVYHIIVLLSLSGCLIAISNQIGDTREFMRQRIDAVEHRIEELQSDCIKSSVGMQTFQREKKWLARAIYSETKRPEEMRYVGTVIRNRVESCYRDKCSYKGVVLDDYQFSAFNVRVPTKTNDAAHQVAEQILTSDRGELPVPKGVTHFYSPQSMQGDPMWAYRMTEVPTEIPSYRFRFFQGDSHTSHETYSAR